MRGITLISTKQSARRGFKTDLHVSLDGKIGKDGRISVSHACSTCYHFFNSHLQFIWVLHAPSKKDASRDRGNDALDCLPDGFFARTHSLGVVVTQRAPQVDILGHASTGGFLSHCGWNSSLESILNGVPMIAWPLYAEQRMNATYLAEEVGVAVRTKIAPTEGVVGREEIETMVRKVMEEQEGKAMRARVKELKISGTKPLTEGGSSFNALSQLAKQCDMNSQAQKVKVP